MSQSELPADEIGDTFDNTNLARTNAENERGEHVSEPLRSVHSSNLPDILEQPPEIRSDE